MSLEHTEWQDRKVNLIDVPGNPAFQMNSAVRETPPNCAAHRQLSSEMVRTGAPSDAVELIVVDQDGRVGRRQDAH